MENKSKKRILIISGNKPRLESLIARLKEYNFEILEATDTSQGLEKALQEKPDLMVIDLNVPKNGVIPFLKNLREDEWGSVAQILLVLSARQARYAAKALNYQVPDYLIMEKFDFHKLLSKIKHITGVHQLSGQ